MAKSRRYSIEVKDAQSKTILVSAAVEWTSDEKQIAVAHIFRLPGVADSSRRTRQLSQRRAAKQIAESSPKQPREKRS